MNRQCSVDGCTRQARPQRRLCHGHRARVARYGDPHFTQWGTADPVDVELIVTEQRPAEGLTRLERVLVARGLTERQVPAAEVARIVGVDKRTVERWRSRDRQKQAA
ncbi:hypothetical protein GCM10010221_45100 [Streptomyces parvus]|uniref:leucine zipper domain-containing protein n=1 Tax=Streptomyces parvus TaxID=66428 RepID=UPI00142EDDA9|nr:leucine zipper domain-containing protein [Streptomyces parvus]GGS41292.1 hypothetical protein GCM10010221_45100 [Streptomyces parvus]